MYVAPHTTNSNQEWSHMNFKKHFVPLTLSMYTIIVGSQQDCSAMHKPSKQHRHENWKSEYRQQCMPTIKNLNAQELLWDAIDQGDLITMQRALNTGADINQGHYGTPLIIEATRNNDSALVRWLITKNAPIDTTDEYGRTALMHAVLQENLAMIKLLIPHANLYKCDDDNNTAYDYATQSPTGPELAQFFEVCIAKQILIDKELIEFDLSDEDDFYGDPDKPLIFRAAAIGCYTLVEQLLRIGVDLNILGPNEQTPLITATFNHHSNIVSLLLAHGAIIDKIDFFGNTARMYALAAENYTIVSLIEEAQSNQDSESDRDSVLDYWPDLFEI